MGGMGSFKETKSEPFGGGSGGRILRQILLVRIPKSSNVSRKGEGEKVPLMPSMGKHTVMQHSNLCMASKVRFP